MKSANPDVPGVAAASLCQLATIPLVQSASSALSAGLIFRITSSTKNCVIPAFSSPQTSLCSTLTDWQKAGSMFNLTRPTSTHGAATSASWETLLTK